MDSNDRIGNDVIIQMLHSIENTQRETRDEVRTLANDLKAIAKVGAEQTPVVLALVKKTDDLELRVRFVERAIWGLLAIFAAVQAFIELRKP
jgi:hypothetical protein